MRSFIKYAPLAAEAFLSIYERMNSKKDSRQKEEEIRTFLAEKIAALTAENRKLQKQVKWLRAFNVLAILFSVVALILHLY